MEAQDRGSLFAWKWLLTKVPAKQPGVCTSIKGRACLIRDQSADRFISKEPQQARGQVSQKISNSDDQIHQTATNEGNFRRRFNCWCNRHQKASLRVDVHEVLKEQVWRKESRNLTTMSLNIAKVLIAKLLLDTKPLSI